MKLLLLQPPVQDFYDTDIRLQPIGLCYLKAAVRKFLPEVEVVVKDYHRGWGRRTIPIPGELAYLKEYYGGPDQSPFSSFHHYYHFGADVEELALDVAAARPDVVGISSLFSPYYREVLCAAEAIKRRLDVPILLGGSHVSAMPEFMLAQASIDFVIRGEGERPLVEFLKAFASGRSFDEVPNLGFKRNGELVFNASQDNYPIEELSADTSDLLLDHYRFEKKPLTFIITSRSCPHRCSFCSVHKTFGFSYRRRSVESVLSEIKERYGAGIRVFDFEDDNLTFYKDEMKTLCRALIDAFPLGDVQFVAMNGISYLSLDAELLLLMRRAGFTHLNIALVTSDTTVRETTKRPHTVEKYLDVVREAARLGFNIVSYQILGLPGESLESMIQTLVFSAEQPVLLGASMFYLTPNSPIASRFPAPTERDVFTARLTAMAIETEQFSRDDIYTLFITTRIINFLKGLKPEARDVSLAEALAWARNAGGRSGLGAEILDRLLDEGKLYAVSGETRRELTRFKTELFRRVWSGLDRLARQDGGHIRVDSLSLCS